MSALRRLLLGACLIGGCGERGERGDPGEPEQADPSTERATPSPAPTPAPAPAGDPFVDGLEPLRPRAWADWPVENVAPTTEFGWRLDPISGRYEQSKAQWFATEERAYVLAIADGRVREIVELGEGKLEVIVEHEAFESRYSPLAQPLVYAGLQVARGTALGSTAGRELALEVRVDDVPIDPLLILRQPPHRWPALLRTP